MNKQLTLVLFLIPLLFTYRDALCQVRFQTGDPDLLQRRAVREGQLLFVYFSATWCMPCQWMEENTFRDMALARFLNRHFLPLKLDIDEATGLEQKKKYRITHLPSMLVIDERNLVIARWEKSLSADRLLSLLQTAYQEHERVVPATVLEAPRPRRQISRPALIPEESIARPSVTPHNEYAALPTPPAGRLSSPAPASVKKSYGVQIAVYSRYDNAVRHMEALERRFQQPVNIFISQKEGREKLYRILIGDFQTAEAAGDYARRLQKQQLNGIVKDLGTL